MDLSEVFMIWILKKRVVTMINNYVVSALFS